MHKLTILLLIAIILPHQYVTHHIHLISLSQVVIQYTLELVLGFLIPYGIIVISYICILRRIRKTKFGRRIRSEKLILAIVLTFCIFWLPYHIINMVQVCQNYML